MCGQGRPGGYGAAARGQPWARPQVRLPTMHTCELVPTRTRSLAPSVQIGEAETDSPAPALHQHSLVPALDCPPCWDPNSTRPALPPDAGRGTPLESRKPDPTRLAAGLEEKQKAPPGSDLAHADAASLRAGAARPHPSPCGLADPPGTGSRKLMCGLGEGRGCPPHPPRPPHPSPWAQTTCHWSGGRSQPHLPQQPPRSQGYPGPQPPSQRPSWGPHVPIIPAQPFGGVGGRGRRTGQVTSCHQGHVGFLERLFQQPDGPKTILLLVVIPPSHTRQQRPRHFQKSHQGPAVHGEPETRCLPPPPGPVPSTAF
ncbi:basic proline-rich protein-like [Mustela erminea]|uniref:basic proline-rich protein-like n=1 Tax=Mustela erminea TaxID=36723 RepID=UPI001387347C|nr:basic proline-rich protein-like [Mustela erminea]